MSAAEKILERLDGVRRSRDGRWRARCPSHGSRGGSLAIAETDGRALLFCHGGCEVEAVLATIGLALSDLYDRPLVHSRERVRRAWNASDVISLVLEESTVVAVIASDVLDQRTLAETDWQRLARASQRLNRLATLVRP
jgi:hypothetical protein